MKRNFWVGLLVFSLAPNLGGLATYAYMRYQNRWKRELGIGTPQAVRPVILKL